MKQHFIPETLLIFIQRMAVVRSTAMMTSNMEVEVIPKAGVAATTKAGEEVGIEAPTTTTMATDAMTINLNQETVNIATAARLMARDALSAVVLDI